MRKAIAALALVFLAAHVAFLPPTLEDVDSINFALGVRHFDVAKHQPHPPGYPVFIAMGKASTSVLRTMGVSSPAPKGLAIWSAVGGAALIFPLFAFVLALDGSERRAWWTTLVVVVSPLFWFTALRPLSDTTGLAAAALAQALTLSVLMGLAAPRALTWGAFVAGLAIGIRSQTLLLTMPLLALALLLPRVKLRLRDRIAASAAGAIGVLTWGIPLIVASGGLSSYAAALGSQAGEDFSGVVMLWNMRQARVAADALTYTFLWPWGHPLAGAIVLGVAAVGCVRAALKTPYVLGILAVAFVPYAIFHLLFHEVITTRYALPLILPVAYLAVSALDVGGRRIVAAGATALAAWSLVATLPAAVLYGAAGSPAFMALSDVTATAAADEGRPRVIAMHAVMRRAADWPRSGSPVRMLKPPHGREWLALVDEWRSNPATIVSFIADPRRTDLALIDPASRRGPFSYRWGFIEPPFVGGARPGNADVYAMRPPGWMLDRGWALTAEVAGVTAKDGYGPHVKPSVAWVRTRPQGATLMIGGRHLGAVDDPPVRITATLNGGPLDSFDARPGFFFRLVDVPAGSLAQGHGYVPLRISAASARGVPASLEQFDLQSPGLPMIGAESGWYEPEYNPRTAQAWRWSSEKATLWVRPIGRNVTLTVSGESPLRYFDRAPSVTVTAGPRELARFSPSSDFTQSVELPADALAAANGRIAIASDKFFVPAERGGPSDRRRLALRIYSYSVK